MSQALEIGDIKIRRIVEQEGPFFPVHDFFRKFTREMMDANRDWLQPRFVDPNDMLNLCIQSYVVETPHHRIMIDTCVGNHKPRPARAFHGGPRSRPACASCRADPSTRRQGLSCRGR